MLKIIGLYYNIIKSILKGLKVMLNESGNLIEENIPITKELLDFAKANDYKISLKTGDYLIGELKANRAKNNPTLVDQLGRLYLDGMMYPGEFWMIFGFKNSGCFRASLKLHLGDNWVDSKMLYPERVSEAYKATNLAKYGVDNASKSSHIKERRKQTNLARYGQENPMKSSTVKEKLNQTNLARYGSIRPLGNEEILKKLQSTNLERYGHVSPFGSEEVRMRMKRIIIERYGSEHNWSSRVLIEKRFPNLAKIKEFKELDLEDPAIAADITEFITENYCRSQSLIHLKELGIKTPTNYLTEVKLCNLLDSLEIEYIHNAKRDHQVRKHNGEYYELDAYIPTLKLGIEINGRAHHSVNKARYGNPKTKDYHFEKFKAFHQSGILMISFTDYEQDNFTEDYINIIKHHLLGEPLNVSKEFLEFNQISNIEESLNYGLFDPNQFTGNFEDHQHQRLIEDFEYWDCGVIKS